MSATVLVSVGSTQFDELVATVQSHVFLKRMSGALGEGVRVLVQHGNSPVDLSRTRTDVVLGTPCRTYEACGAVVSLFDYVPSLDAFLNAATVVVAHAGVCIVAR